MIGDCAMSGNLNFPTNEAVESLSHYPIPLKECRHVSHMMLLMLQEVGEMCYSEQICRDMMTVTVFAHWVIIDM